MTPIKKGIGLAVLAACLYAISTPFSKLLLSYISPTLLAGFLYLGAGLGMFFLRAGRKLIRPSAEEERLTKAELPYTAGMIVLDIAAPIFLMLGLTKTTAANASLLNNFEIVATSFIAFFVFREKISRKLWLGILFVTVSCCILSFEDPGSLQCSAGSLFVLLAACCWGLENNCTRMISSKDPLQIVLLKGIFSGTGSVLIGLFAGESLPAFRIIACVLLLGFIAYGLSIYAYVYAQRLLGASRTSAYYAAAPFVGTLLSLALFRTAPGIRFFIAVLFMLAGAWLSSADGS